MKMLQYPMSRSLIIRTVYYRSRMKKQKRNPPRRTIHGRMARSLLAISLAKRISSLRSCRMPDKSRAVSLLAQAKIPQVRQYITRRLAALAK